MKPTLITLICLAAAATAIHAQAPPIPGSRIRITAPSLRLDREVGTLLALSQDTVVLRRASDTVTIARTALTGFDVSEGHKVLQSIGVTALEGALGGAVFGFLLGKAFGLLRGDPAPCVPDPDQLLACWDYDFAKGLADPVEEAKLWGGLGLTGGIIAGTIQAASEHWGPVLMLGAKPSITFERGRPSFGFSVRF